MAESPKTLIGAGECALGIEFGSTRIKSVLTDPYGNVLGVGVYDWENRLEGGFWTYREDEMLQGLQGSYASLCDAVMHRHGCRIERLCAIGISGMMHGYLPLDREGKILAPFRTWRNTVTATESEILTDALQVHIPQRWSAAHLFRAIRNREEHLSRLAHLTTLAGYIHYLLTGEFVLGIGEASGVFPVDRDEKDYDREKMEIYRNLCEKEGFLLPETVFPRILCAGEPAGRLTEAGARLLDPTGTLAGGIPFCPPEGDAGTGMVATNSLLPGTGNVSAGTSIFAMAVLEQPLSGVFREIDGVATPVGDPVAMVHCNNCTGEIDRWVGMFSEFSALSGFPIPKGKLYDLIYQSALREDASADGYLLYNYLSGEHLTGVPHGAPLLARSPGTPLRFPGFSRALLFSALATVRLGMDILRESGQGEFKEFCGHGGFFKTPGVGQAVTAAALKTPVVARATAGEGGAWGMALLALYMALRTPGETLDGFLRERVFSGIPGTRAEPDAELSETFELFLSVYRRGLDVVRSADRIFAEGNENDG